MQHLSAVQPLADADLWKQVQEGDSAAFDALVLRFYRMLFHYGSKFSDDEEFVKDCLQDLFVDVWQRRERLSSTQFVRQYLLKALRHRIFQETRRPLTRLIERSFSVEGYAFRIEFSVEDDLILAEATQEQVARLNRALLRLSPRQREAIYLKFYQNLSTDELTAVMGLQEQSLRNLLHEAILALRKQMLLSVLVALAGG